MKPRPRFAENRVAEILSAFFVSIGHDPVERQPVIGRTGPDLTLNAFKLAVDVKSRLEVPKSYIVEFVVSHGDLITIPLKYLPTIAAERKWIDGPFIEMPCSKTVEDYWNHMNDWTSKKVPDGISAIVLHRPGLRFGLSQLVLHSSQISLFKERLQHDR